MNAAAKYINQSNFFQGQFAKIRLSSMSILQMSLIVAVFLSSLAIIYVTNMYRITYNKLEISENQTHQLQLKWGKLLLERASLATPYRVEKVAREKLNMVFINNNIIPLRIN